MTLSDNIPIPDGAEVTVCGEGVRFEWSDEWWLVQAHDGALYIESGEPERESVSSLSWAFGIGVVVFLASFGLERLFDWASALMVVGLALVCGSALIGMVSKVEKRPFLILHPNATSIRGRGGNRDVTTALTFGARPSAVRCVDGELVVEGLPTPFVVRVRPEIADWTASVASRYLARAPMGLPKELGSAPARLPIVPHEKKDLLSLVLFGGWGFGGFFALIDVIKSVPATGVWLAISGGGVKLFVWLISVVFVFQIRNSALAATARREVESSLRLLSRAWIAIFPGLAFAAMFAFVDMPQMGVAGEIWRLANVVSCLGITAACAVVSVWARRRRQAIEHQLDVVLDFAHTEGAEARERQAVEQRS